MAAYTDNHHSYCNHLSLSSGLTSGTQHHNQEVSISELVDHGSISFGRFAAESLAWEKWSVFSHNRCQEELEKFRAPGLVAQKKAFFEEYYKKIRAMKKLQAEQQEANKSKLCQEEKNVTHVDKGAEITEPEEERNSNDTIQTHFSGTTEDESLVAEEQGQNSNDNIISRHEIKTSLAMVVDEEKGQNPNDNIINRDEIKTSLATVVDEEQGTSPNDNVINRDEIKRSSATVVNEEQGQNPNDNIINTDEIEASSATIVDKADQVPVSLIKMCLKSSHQDGRVSSTVKLNAERPRDCAPLSKAKGTVTSARDKTKLDYRTKKDATKPSEKQKLSLDKDTSGKSTISHALSERPSPKLARNPKSDTVTSHRPSMIARSSATLSQTSVLKDRPTSSSSVRSGVPKANLNSTSAQKDRPTSSYSVRSGVPKANLNSTSVLKDRPTSSYSGRSGVPKANVNSTLVLKDRPTSSYSVRNGVPKANLNSTSVLKDRPTYSYSVRSGVPKANLNSTSVLKDRPTYFYSVRSGVPKANLNSNSVLNLNSKGSMNKMQTTSKQKTVTNAVDNVVPLKRGHAGVVGKSLEPSSCFMMPKRGLPENQKPKVGLTNSPARIKPKQNLGNESGLKNDSKEGNRTRILPWQSADLTHARREPRPKTPGWR